jgi:hypothetical protein
MKYALKLNADQLFEVHRGLELRITECEKQLKRARSGRSKDEWSHQLFCARLALLHVEEVQSTIGAVPFSSEPAM